MEQQAKFFLAGHEEYKSKLKNLENARKGEILECQNEVQKLKEMLESLQMQTLRLQEENTRARKKAQERTLMLGQIKMACDNIFDRVQGRSTLKKMPKMDDPVQLLRASGNTLQDLIAIVTEYDQARSASHGQRPVHDGDAPQH